MTHITCADINLYLISPWMSVIAGHLCTDFKEICERAIFMKERFGRDVKFRSMAKPGFLMVEGVKKGIQRLRLY